MVTTADAFDEPFDDFVSNVKLFCFGQRTTNDERRTTTKTEDKRQKTTNETSKNRDL